MNNKFIDVLNKYQEQLDLYIPVVSKVHGKTHNEFYLVKDIYEKMRKDFTIDLTNDFNKLKEVTNNYLKPTDTCESYHAVYDMLKELNESYEEVK